MRQRKNKQSHPGFSYVKTRRDIHEFTLNSNDLSVLVREEHTVPVATFMVTYRVGSRNESIGTTGSTHILEHMMFKESKHYPRNYWTTLFDKGARQNATTWLDRTNYYQTLPVEYLEETVGYEADRMRNAILKKEDLDTEMVVVRNEYERGENDPYQALDKELWATAYQAHPYHHSTIGWLSDIENTTVERLREFYDIFYWPNNATVTVIGDFKTAEALSMIRRYFEKVPRSPIPIPPMLMTEPKQEGPRRFAVRRPGETNIVGIAHKIPPALSSDTFAIQVLGSILGSGKSSRLYRRLMDSGLASNFEVWSSPFHDNGLFISYAWPTKGVTHEKIEAAILEEYEKLKKSGVSTVELKRAKAKFVADLAFSRDGSYSVAGALNECIALGDWAFYERLATEINRVKADDVRRVANAYLNETVGTTGYFIGQKSQKNQKKKK